MDCTEKTFTQEQVQAARTLLNRRQAQLTAAQKVADIQLKLDEAHAELEEAEVAREAGRQLLWRLLGGHDDDDCKLKWKAELMRQVETGVVKIKRTQRLLKVFFGDGSMLDVAIGQAINFRGAVHSQVLIDRIGREPGTWYAISSTTATDGCVDENLLDSFPNYHAATIFLDGYEKEVRHDAGF